MLLSTHLKMAAYWDFGAFSFVLGGTKGIKWSLFFEDIIERKTGNRKSTFKDFKEKGYKDLRLVGTNLTQNKSVIFSHTCTPNMPVAEAMRISSSVPLFFEAKYYKGDLHVDGGLMRNYAISEFDKKTSSAKHHWIFPD